MCSRQRQAQGPRRRHQLRSRHLPPSLDLGTQTSQSLTAGLLTGSQTTVHAPDLAQTSSAEYEYPSGRAHRRTRASPRLLQTALSSGRGGRVGARKPPESRSGANTLQTGAAPAPDRRDVPARNGWSALTCPASPQSPANPIRCCDPSLLAFSNPYVPTARRRPSSNPSIPVPNTVYRVHLVHFVPSSRRTCVSLFASLVRAAAGLRRVRRGLTPAHLSNLQDRPRTRTRAAGASMRSSKPQTSTPSRVRASSAIWDGCAPLWQHDLLANRCARQERAAPRPAQLWPSR